MHVPHVVSVAGRSVGNWLAVGQGSRPSHSVESDVDCHAPSKKANCGVPASSQVTRAPSVHHGWSSATYKCTRWADDSSIHRGATTARGRSDRHNTLTRTKRTHDDALRPQATPTPASCRTRAWVQGIGVRELCVVEERWEACTGGSDAFHASRADHCGGCGSVGWGGVSGCGGAARTTALRGNGSPARHRSPAACPSQTLRARPPMSLTR